MNGKSALMVMLAGLLLAGSMTRSTGAAPGLPLTDPFGTRFTPVPVRDAPIQGRPLHVVRGRRLHSPQFSPGGRYLAFSHTVVLRKLRAGDYADPNHPIALDEVRILDVSTGRLLTVLSTRETRKAAVYSGLLAEMGWIDGRRLKASIFNGDDEFTIFTVDVPSRTVVDVTSMGVGVPEPTPVHEKAREQARALFPNLDKALLDDYAWGYAYLQGDLGVLLQKPTQTTSGGTPVIVPGDVWFLDFRQRTARRLIAFREPVGTVNGAVRVGESTLFLLSGLQRARLFLYRGDRVEPLIELRASMASLSPLLVTPDRAYFVLWWAIADLRSPINSSPPPRATIYVFDGRTLQRSNDYPSLFAADIDSSRRLVALAYRGKTGDRIVVAKLAR